MQQTILLGIFVGLGPIYWLPGIPPTLLALIKGILLVLFVGSAISQGLAQKWIPLLPAGLPGPVGLAILVLAAVPAVFQGAPADAARCLSQPLVMFGFMWAVRATTASGVRVTTSFAIAALIVAAASALIILAWMTNNGAIQAPAQFGGFVLADGGFGGARTGWSAAMAVMLPVAIWAVPQLRLPGRSQRLLMIGTVASIVGSQFVVGGRGGLLVSLFILSVALAGRWMSLRLAVLASLAALVFPIMSLFSIRFDAFLGQELADRLRLSELGSYTSFEALDYLTTGRLSTIRSGLIAFAERPLLGHGYEVFVAEDALNYEVHNTYVQLLVDGGIGYLLGYLVVLGTTCSLALRHLPSSWRYAGLVLLAGATMAMLEPRTIIRVFQNTAVWWAVLGACLGVSEMMLARRRAVSRTFAVPGLAATRAPARFGQGPARIVRP